MTSYRTEVQNVTHAHIPNWELSACRNMFMIPVFIIPGVETPFRGLQLKHDWGNSK